MIWATVSSRCCLISQEDAFLNLLLGYLVVEFILERHYTFSVPFSEDKQLVLLPNIMNSGTEAYLMFQSVASIVFVAAKIVPSSGWFPSPLDVTLGPLIASLLSDTTRHSRLILNISCCWSGISSFSRRSLYFFK